MVFIDHVKRSTRGLTDSSAWEMLRVEMEFELCRERESARFGRDSERVRWGEQHTKCETRDKNEYKQRDHTEINDKPKKKKNNTEKIRSASNDMAVSSSCGGSRGVVLDRSRAQQNVLRLMQFVEEIMKESGEGGSSGRDRDGEIRTKMLVEFRYQFTHFRFLFSINRSCLFFFSRLNN